jgi:hypothetical protein
MKKKVFIVLAIVLTIVSVGFLPKVNIIKTASAKVINNNCSGDTCRICATGSMPDGGTWAVYGYGHIVRPT